MFSEKSFPDGKVRMPEIGKFDETRTTLLPQWIDLVVTLVKEGWAVELGDWKFEIGNCRATASAILDSFAVRAGRCRGGRFDTPGLKHDA